jgi:fermentation-respiration switch protein FrsA (DUF1100 family)
MEFDISNDRELSFGIPFMYLDGARADIVMRQWHRPRTAVECSLDESHEERTMLPEHAESTGVLHMPLTQQFIARAAVAACAFLASTVSLAAGADTPASAMPNASAAQPVSSTAAAQSYLDRRTAFKTHLIHKGHSPQPFKVQSPPAGVREVVYPSGQLALKAWVALPAGASSDKKVPGVVFFHGGYAFGAGDFEDARPFLDAGFAVMTPTLRGENGNPGDFEMLLGEVDDASAAIDWFATQPEVDASHIYTFGHSAGGIVSALLSLRPVPIRHGGSSGGLYGVRAFDFDWLKGSVPFALDDPHEREMRVLVGNLQWMQQKHYAFVGAGDPDQEVGLVKGEIRPGTPLVVTVIPGDHFTSLAPAVKAYIEVIRGEP